MLNKKVLLIAIIAAVALCAGFVTHTNTQRLAYAHCQIPCGIYDDPMRFNMLSENITTLEKAVSQINSLSPAEAAANANQLVRWTINKDATADDFAHIVTYYFLQQRIKPTESANGAEYKAYLHKLELCHLMLVNAMKVKQNVDTQYTDKLRTLLEEFKQSYFTKEELEKMNQGH